MARLGRPEGGGRGPAGAPAAFHRPWHQRGAWPGPWAHPGPLGVYGPAPQEMQYPGCLAEGTASMEFTPGAHQAGFPGWTQAPGAAPGADAGYGVPAVYRGSGELRTDPSWGGPSQAAAPGAAGTPPLGQHTSAPLGPGARPAFAGVANARGWGAGAGLERPATAELRGAGVHQRQALGVRGRDEAHASLGGPRAAPPMAVPSGAEAEAVHWREGAGGGALQGSSEGAGARQGGPRCTKGDHSWRLLCVQRGSIRQRRTAAWVCAGAPSACHGAPCAGRSAGSPGAGGAFRRAGQGSSGGGLPGVAPSPGGRRGSGGWGQLAKRFLTGPLRSPKGGRLGAAGARRRDAEAEGAPEADEGGPRSTDHGFWGVVEAGVGARGVPQRGARQGTGLGAGQHSGCSPGVPLARPGGHGLGPRRWGEPGRGGCEQR